jgi:hypothetical protein
MVKCLRVVRHINTLMRANQFTPDATARHKRNRYIRRLHQMTGWDTSHLELLSNDELRDLHIQHQQERNNEPTDEAMSAGLRMQRALQREKEKRERSERYAEKHFPIGKPKEEPKNDQNTKEEMVITKVASPEQKAQIRKAVTDYNKERSGQQSPPQSSDVKKSNANSLRQDIKDFNKVHQEGMCEVCGTSLAEHGKASLKLCKSSRPDAELGASNLASCKSQGLRARDGDKSHKLGKGPDSRVKVGGHKIKGKKYGGPLPDWS